MVAMASGQPSLADFPREALLEWDRRHRVGYPWRGREHDPYAVLVSEVMLQQTQASRVGPIFLAFLGRFPDVGALAAASRADVLRAWRGLGYHRRAVALHEAARAIVRDNDGRIPSTFEGLLALPGVGPYTAAAVASIAFDRPVAAVDTNIRKVLARAVLGMEPDEVQAKDVAAAASAALSVEHPGDWNQALMNLGRAVCRPTPRCDECPLAPACLFRSRGRAGRRSSRAQPAFAGSLRQIRGAVVRTLGAGARTPEELARETGHEVAGIRAAIEALSVDGIVEPASASAFRLAGDTDA
jgi:A/G-specific adenine glycosylase